MPRTKCYRHIENIPNITYYKPVGIPLREMEEESLGLDEFEAIRLADFEGLYQEEAALRMKISRQTFGRILMLAHQKIASALIHGKAIRFEHPANFHLEPDSAREVEPAKETER
ncbi:MAG TPA: hypothetical protein DCQ26_08290 [Marinilabiliales bacterium]|jgi:predicted DNA-binding protein (UPF0251 family)|nr:MAG: hypothetical protein A2W95_10055 [Bacteroidetes bacterium GWA2_40_14]OFX63126.1 MAG: hypothetical protein A2W84_03535 [Bacteroidetes bacterium GWC2_40_13]OFX75728.1 MAG: hypothetical protein A2W96_09170 [Bacteroidetes bacterium GWD2_40_43]OFX94999.1 MAG: hypothetical protein A2W97_16670 [Bacteroidetes bacterium GWE2_40_63]OFY23510.1 MAG: hypothetical protein A2W88_08485 [Bacteroidetes bacterium GWF2_40_13]OFZ29364.1 MAG: hypothetical protein A2437_09115 [Bacteroidetes bacterium RIFOXYC